MKKKRFLLVGMLAIVFGAFSFTTNKVASKTEAADLPETTCITFTPRANSDNPSAGTSGYTFNLVCNNTNNATLNSYSEITHTLLDVDEGVYVDYSVQAAAYKKNERFVVSFPECDSMTLDHYYYLTIPKGTILGGTVKLANEITIYFKHQFKNSYYTAGDWQTPLSGNMGEVIPTTASAKRNYCNDSEGCWYFNVDAADYESGYQEYGNFLTISDFIAGEYTYLNHILFAEDPNGPWVPFIEICGQNHINRAVYLRQGGGNDIRMSVSPNYKDHTRNYQFVKILAGCSFPSWNYTYKKVNGLSPTNADKIQYTTTEDSYSVSVGIMSESSGTYIPQTQNSDTSTVYDTTSIAGGWNGSVKGDELHTIFNFSPKDGTKVFSDDSRITSYPNWAASFNNNFLFNGQPVYKIDGIQFNYNHGMTYGLLKVKTSVLVASNGYSLPTFEFKAGAYFVGQYLNNMVVTYDSSKAEGSRFSIVEQASVTSNITAANNVPAQGIHINDTYTRAFLFVNWGNDAAAPTGHHGYTNVYIQKVGEQTEKAYQAIFYVNNQILVDNWIDKDDHSSQVGIYKVTIKAGSTYGVASKIKAYVPNDVVLYVYVGLTYTWTVTPEDYALLEDFVTNSMHMSDYTESLGYCNDTTHKYYKNAKARILEINTINSIDFQIFMWCEAYNAALTRLQAWAVANGETLTPQNGTFASITPSNRLIISQEKTNYIIPIAAFVILTSVIGIYLLKRKEN